VKEELEMERMMDEHPGYDKKEGDFQQQEQLSLAFSNILFY
jgi:hypothetical protein